MKSLKRIRYDTMSSWNNATAPAYNLKVYNVVNNDLQDKVFELMECEDFYDDINWMMSEFDRKFDYCWQTGFNGRSGGYLVLYKGGRKLSEHKSYCTACGQRNFTSVKKTGKKCGACRQEKRMDHTFYDTFTWPGKGVDDDEVPTDVLKAFRKLAVGIVKHVEYVARNATVEEETYMVEKTRKVVNF